MASSGGREYREGYDDDSPPRPRDALPVPRRRRIGSRHRREDRAWLEGRLRDGRRRRRADPASRRLAREVTLLSEQDLATGGSRPVRHHHDRHARVCGPRRSEDVQPPPPRIREERRQPDRPLQHAGVRAEPVCAVSRQSCPQVRRRSRRRIRRSRSSLQTIRSLTTPNRITKADFDNWVEQRGSKFFGRVGSRRTRRLIATWDKGQQPQKGGWLHGEVRQGALHVLRVRLPPAAAVRRSGRLSPAGEPAVAEPGHRKTRTHTGRNAEDFRVLDNAGRISSRRCRRTRRDSCCPCIPFPV